MKNKLTESETPVNSVGDASNVAGLDNNPPAKKGKKGKKLSVILRRK